MSRLSTRHPLTPKGGELLDMAGCSSSPCGLHRCHSAGDLITYWPRWESRLSTRLPLTSLWWGKDAAGWGKNPGFPHVLHGRPREWAHYWPVEMTIKAPYLAISEVQVHHLGRGRWAGTPCHWPGVSLGTPLGLHWHGWGQAQFLLRCLAGLETLWSISFLCC